MREFFYRHGIFISVVFVAIGLLSLSINEMAQANSAPSYRSFAHYSVSDTYVDSTVAVEVLPAPGADMKWWIENATVIVLDNEANATIYVEDNAATPTSILTAPTDVLGAQYDYYFGQGIECHQNSAVMLEFSGSSTEIFLNVTARKEKY